MFGLNAAHPGYAAGGHIGDCTFPTLQTDLQTGGDWFYTSGQCTLPIVFTNSIPIGLTASLTAQGGDVVLSGGGDTQLFSVSSGASFGLTGLTLSGGSADFGGAIENSGSLTLTSSALNNNSAGEGGALYNSGTLTLTASMLSDNSATSGNGGAIENYSAVDVAGSVFSGNSTSSGDGGAMDNEASASVVNSTLSTNTAIDGGAVSNEDTLTVTTSSLKNNSATVGNGGAIENYATASIVRSTVAGNSATDGDGGALENDGTATISISTLSNNIASAGDGGAVNNNAELDVSFSTLSGNIASAGGAIYNGSNTLTIAATIIANSTGGNCSANTNTITDNGRNLEDDAGATPTCQFSTGSPSFDLVGQDPALLPLGENGGPTQTMALQDTGPVSPAIDAIPTTSLLCPSTGTVDQRNSSRPSPSGGACDIGAFESGGSPTTATISYFLESQRGKGLLFEWRLTGAGNVIGFVLASRAPHSTKHLIPVHSRATYRVLLHTTIRGSYTLRTLFANGRSLTLHPKKMP
jgi:hypothetical protein